MDNDYFALYRIRLREGRLFQPSDTGTDVVIGEAGATATGLTPQPSGIFTIGGGDPYRVLGVVNEVRSPSNDPRTDCRKIYRPLKLTVDGQVVARAFGSGDQLLDALRRGLPQLEELHSAFTREREPSSADSACWTTSS